MFVISFIVLARWYLVFQTKEIRNLVEACEAMQKRQSRKSEMLTIAVLNLQEQLLTHDLTVRGINPAAGEDFETRDSKALPVYESLKKGMEELRDNIKDLK